MDAVGHATFTGLRIKKEPEEEEILTHTEQVQENVRTLLGKVEQKLENLATGKKHKSKGSKASEKKAKSIGSQ